MAEERIVNYGKEFSELRQLLRISQRDFAKMSSIPLEEIISFESGDTSNLLYKRIKISLTLTKIISAHYQELPEILIKEVKRVIEVLNPFDQIENFYELFKSMNDFKINTDKFLDSKAGKRNR